MPASRIDEVFEVSRQRREKRLSLLHEADPLEGEIQWAHQNFPTLPKNTGFASTIRG